ncbi:MAG: M20/M25/M40 family metallo-hydrolase [Pseudomonadota bacterium]
MSRADSAGFALLAATARAVFGDIIVAPGLTIATLDARHYAEVAEDVYRFNPFLFGPDDLPRLHGVNERLSVSGLAQAVRFYSTVMTAP